MVGGCHVRRRHVGPLACTTVLTLWGKGLEPGTWTGGCRLHSIRLHSPAEVLRARWCCSSWRLPTTGQSRLGSRLSAHRARLDGPREMDCCDTRLGIISHQPPSARHGFAACCLAAGGSVRIHLGTGYFRPGIQSTRLQGGAVLRNQCDRQRRAPPRQLSLAHGPHGWGDRGSRDG